MKPIYLDHNATSPLDPRVLEAMEPHWLATGNPESRHQFGRATRRAYDQARDTVAEVLHAHPDEVVFTSGGTEANNLALFGLASGGMGACGASRAALPIPGRIVTSPIEHPAVSVPLERLRALGFRVEVVPVPPSGRMDARAMVEALATDARLAALILAHNETGVLQPVAELAHGATELGVPVHTDAVQAVGRIPVDFHALGVSTLAASAHKFHGPVGVGVLLVRRGVHLGSLLLGGDQQRGRRPGTPAVALAVGLATALLNWQRERSQRLARWIESRDHLEAGLTQVLGPTRVVRTGPADSSLRLPQTLHVGFPGIDGDALLMQLDLAGVAVSTGSACASGSSRPSPSLVAMGVPQATIRSSVRFSLGMETTLEEVDEAIHRIVAIVNRLQVDQHGLPSEPMAAEFAWDPWADRLQ